LRASLALSLNYGLNEDVMMQNPQQQQQSFWIIDLAGQVSHFPGLFRLKVYPEEAGGSGSGSSGSGADSIEELEEHEKMPDGEPLLDYEVGVFEENKFEVSKFCKSI
uniref:SH2 domain-containing protein n=1 Tax=Hydatigena taeniaeformis TaxID=6205 RepID=A0A0R3WWD7_HYDTA